MNTNPKEKGVWLCIRNTWGICNVGGGLNHPDYRSMIIEPIYRIAGKLYEIKEDGWLIIQLVTNGGGAVLSVPLEEFDTVRTIETYNPAIQYNQWSKIVKYNGSYWLPISTAAANNPNAAPGGSINRWRVVPSWMPTLAVAHSGGAGTGDQTSSLVMLPVFQGERYIAVIYEDVQSDFKQLCGTEFGYRNANNIALQFLPLTYKTTPVGLLDTGNSYVYQDNLRYNNYRHRLTGLDPYMNDPDLT